MKVLKGVLAHTLAIFCLAALACAGQALSAQPDTPWGITPNKARWDAAVATYQSLKDAPSITQLSRSALDVRYVELDTLYRTFLGKTHPFFTEARSYDVIAAAYRKDLAAYTADVGKYEADCNQYNSTVPKTAPPEQMGYWTAWHDKLVAWKDRLLQWKGRLDKDHDQLESTRTSLSSKQDECIRLWYEQLDAFEAQMRRAVYEGKLADLDGKIEKMRAQIKQDQRALGQYIKNNTTYVQAIEDAINLGEDAANEARMKALETVLTLACEQELKKLGGQIELKQEHLKTLEKLFEQYDVPDWVKKDWIARWKKGAKSIQALRTKQDFLKSQTAAVDVLKTADASVRGKYFEATLNFMSIILHHPGYKLLIANGELYTGLYLAHVAGNESQALMKQFIGMSDANLQAAKKLTDVCDKHVKALIELKKQREELASTSD